MDDRTPTLRWRMSRPRRPSRRGGQKRPGFCTDRGWTDRARSTRPGRLWHRSTIAPAQSAEMEDCAATADSSPRTMRWGPPLRPRYLQPAHSARAVPTNRTPGSAGSAATRRVPAAGQGANRSRSACAAAAAGHRRSCPLRQWPRDSCRSPGPSSTSDCISDCHVVGQKHVRRPAGARLDGRARRRRVDYPYQCGVALDPGLRRSVRHLEDFSLARDPVRADVRPLPALIQCDHSPPSSDARPEKGELLRRCRTADDDAREAVGRRDEGRQSMRGDLQIDAVAAGHGASDGGAVIRRDHQSGNAETRRGRHLGLVPPDQHFRGGRRGGDQPGCECDRGNTEAENEPGAGDRPVARLVSAHVKSGARTAGSSLSFRRRAPSRLPRHRQTGQARSRHPRRAR